MTRSIRSVDPFGCVPRGDCGQRLLELDPSPAPTPPTLQYTSPRAGQPNIFSFFSSTIKFISNFYFT